MRMPYVLIQIVFTFHPLVGRGSETQLQASENLKSMISAFRANPRNNKYCFRNDIFYLIDFRLRFNLILKYPEAT